MSSLSILAALPREVCERIVPDLRMRTLVSIMSSSGCWVRHPVERYMPEGADVCGRHQ